MTPAFVEAARLPRRPKLEFFASAAVDDGVSDDDAKFHHI
jgi:hypothetical protein